jgi:TetR/AcrR family transcriptional regulator, transcriptional repressor for nem operon
MAAGSARGDAGTGASTVTRILDIAEELVQARGFNGFSYADIAAAVGISKAALHYHFPGKADLGLALITRYAGRFTESLASIDRTDATPADRVAEYARLYDRVLRQGRMCLCGMLAAEYQTLPGPMQAAVADFFEANENWLEKVLEDGRQDASLRFAGTARETARMIIACLEGAMLVARPSGDPDRVRSIAASLLAGLARPEP